MDIVVIADTHGLHKEVPIPPGDVIIHAGDISNVGKPQELKDFFNWFNALNIKVKIFIAGNHDFLFEKNGIQARSFIPDGVIYLQDSAVEVEGVKIYGSPTTPEFMDWAFMAKRGEDIRRYWEKIPTDTDILITHGPPHGILDQTIEGIHAGCEELKTKVFQIRPKYHVFGHIHEAYGQQLEDEVTFVNASIVNADYNVVNKPVTLKY
jgi:Icc-related predicted phosphoesterase